MNNTGRRIRFSIQTCGFDCTKITQLNQDLSVLAGKRLWPRQVITGQLILRLYLCCANSIISRLRLTSFGRTQIIGTLLGLAVAAGGLFLMIKARNEQIKRPIGLLVESFIQIHSTADFGLFAENTTHQERDIASGRFGSLAVIRHRIRSMTGFGRKAAVHILGAHFGAQTRTTYRHWSGADSK
jgi:hypothetical protein